MKKSILFGLVSLIIIMPLLVVGCGQKASKEVILASFDKQVVTANELEKEISELPEWKQDKYKDESGRSEYLTLMAESRMILGVAKERKLDKNQQILNEVKTFQEELMRDELNKREVDDKVKVSDLDVEKYYAENKANYVDPDRIVVTEVTLKDEEKAKEAMDKINAGEDFTELAKAIDSKGESFGPGQGNGGKTRPFSRDSYSSAKEFVDKAFALKPGEICKDIIIQPLGEDTFYMIVRQDEFMPSKQKELSEVKDDAKRSVEKDMKETRKKSWIDQLKEEKKVEIFADKIPSDPEPKPEGEEKQAENKEKEDEAFKPVNPDIVLAKVGKETITLNQINKNISEMPGWKHDRYKDQAGKKNYLNELVEEKLLTLVAYDQKLNEESEIKRQAKEYTDQLMLKELVKVEVDDKVKIEDADLQKYYEENKEDYVEPEKVIVTEITLKSEDKAKEIMDRIKAGEDFTELAKEIDAKGESFGPGQGKEGKTIAFNRNSYSSAKEFSEKAFSLPIGEISDIIVQPMGPDTFYMIIRKDEQIPSKQQEFSEVKDDIQREVEREKKRMRIEQWLEEMKKAKNFKLFIDRIPKPVVKEDETKQKDDKADKEGTEPTEKPVEETEGNTPAQPQVEGK